MTVMSSKFESLKILANILTFAITRLWTDKIDIKDDRLASGTKYEKKLGC